MGLKKNVVNVSAGLLALGGGAALYFGMPVVGYGLAIGSAAVLFFRKPIYNFIDSSRSKRGR